MINNVNNSFCLKWLEMNETDKKMYKIKYYVGILRNTIGNILDEYEKTENIDLKNLKDDDKRIDEILEYLKIKSFEVLHSHGINSEFNK